MTRKDYVALAEALHGARPAVLNGTQQEIGRAQTWWNCMAAIEAVLAADNPRFDRERFVRACQGDK